MIEAQQHLQQPHHAGAFADHDHAARAHARAGLAERGMVVGDGLDLGGGQHLGRNPAGHDALDGRVVQAAAAVFVDELRQRRAVLDFVHAGPLHVARDRHQLRTRALGRADLAEGLATHGNYCRHVGQSLHVVDDGGALVQAAHRESGRPVARVALAALDGGDEGRGLAADVAARAAVDHQVAGEVGAQDALADVAGGIGLFHRRGQAPVGQVEFAADVDEGVAHLQRVGRNQHRLQQQVRRVLQDPAVLEGAGLALVGVGAQVVRLAVVELDHAPLAPGREGGAAVAQDARCRHFLGHLFGPHLAQHLVQRGIAAACAAVRQQMRRGGDREGHDELAARHLPSPSISASSRSALMFSW